mgnify:CR=1 FL=1
MTKVIQTPSKNLYRIEFNIVSDKNSLKVEDLSVHNSEGQYITLSQIDEMEAFFIEMEINYVIMDMINLKMEDNNDDE